MSEPSWPSLSPEALFGVAGDFVRLVGPHSEADPAALLAQFLIGVGSVLGRGPHFVAEADRHGLNLYGVLVGETAKARKGASWGHVERALAGVDAAWVGSCVVSGLSSGEGLMYAVRDPMDRLERGKGKGEELVKVLADPGADDKRLLVQEAEFASTLRVLGRDGNTLSPILRNAWDGRPLRSMTKNSPLKATGAHVSIIGHITGGELRRYLTDTEMGNGFGNRFAYFCVRRSKCLPDGGNVPQETLRAFVVRLENVIRFARDVGEMRRDDAARKLWHEVYERLSEGRPGLLGAMTARAEAQVMRYACLYALLDGSEVVREPHLRAALALWEYAQDSAAYVFGDALGDPTADRILEALRARPEGMRRTEIVEQILGGHVPRATVDRALDLLVRHQLARMEPEETGGRPAERWFARARGAR